MYALSQYHDVLSSILPAQLAASLVRSDFAVSEEPKLCYEIELKALLSEHDHDHLCRTLPLHMYEVEDASVHTIRYRPGDCRLRRSTSNSSSELEFVCKEHDPTVISRRELRLPLVDKTQYRAFQRIMKEAGMTADPPWMKRKREFVCQEQCFPYVVCLQNIDHFGYLLEVEALCDTNDVEIHEPRLRAIFKMLGCQPINPADFLAKIDAYIKKNNRGSASGKRSRGRLTA